MNFEEWYEQEIGSGNKPEYEAAKWAWNHQQAKIDCMQVELDGANERAMMMFNHKNAMVDKMQSKIDELQERINEALNTLCKLQYSSGERIYNDVGNILKGNKDEK